MTGAITIRKSNVTAGAVVLQISIRLGLLSRILNFLMVLRQARSQSWEALNPRVLRDIGKSEAEAEFERALRSWGTRARPTEQELRGQLQLIRSRQ